MFVGHGLVAFALLALAGRALGWERRGTLVIAVTAFAFGTLPDVDIVYAPVGLLGGVSGVFDAAEAFWATSTVVHRAMTHSLPVAVVAALAFGLWSARYDDRFGTRETATVAAVALLSGLVAAAVVLTGALAGLVLAVFAGGGVLIATVAGRHGVAPRAVAGTALLGLGTHPFGDLFTGEPPALLYPLDVTLVAERVTLHPDPTLHLLGAFALELATLWLAAAAGFALYDRRLRDHVSPRAAVGVGYAGAALALPAPTLAESYQFVFSVLALGVVGTVRTERDGLRSALSRRPALQDPATALVTGLSAVTLGAAGYALAYLLL
ncbi:MAG: metal-dependent hydrolase [Halorientalis sp.]